MTLSIYDPIKGCNVLNPDNFKPIINAFHPDYVKTYMPELLSAIKLEASQKANGIAVGTKTKEVKEAKNKAAFTTNIERKPRFDIAPREFHIYNRAGAKNVTPKGKKK